MIKWLRKLLGLCEHKWVMKQIVTNAYGKYETYEYYLQCEKCGNIKKDRV